MGFRKQVSRKIFGLYNIAFEIWDFHFGEYNAVAVAQGLALCDYKYDRLMCA